MALRKPKLGDKLSYFTNRILEGGKGRAKVWRFEGEELANIEYKCPHCGFSGEKQQKFERRKIYTKDPKTGKRKKIDAFVFVCDRCKAEIKLEKWGRGFGRKRG